MMIDWANFTPLASLVGGVLLGVASSILILVNGRVLGISGILAGLLPPKPKDTSWRIAFLLGMLASPLIYNLLGPKGFVHAPRIDADLATILGAGLLVGIGTRYGSGCTSGHGVCGLSRLSPRSGVATMAFMGGGFAMVFIVRHVL